MTPVTVRLDDRTAAAAAAAAGGQDRVGEWAAGLVYTALMTDACAAATAYDADHDYPDGDRDLLADTE